MATDNRTDERRAVGEDLAPPQTAARTQRAEHILDTAAVLLVRWGYRKTTVDDVAREAGVAKGTIYLHWKDKNELFRAALMRAPGTGQAPRCGSASPPIPRAGCPSPLDARHARGPRQSAHGRRHERPNRHLPGAARRLRTGDHATACWAITEAYIVQLQQAGLIRADLPVSIIAFVTSALKIGLINTPDLFGRRANAAPGATDRGDQRPDPPLAGAGTLPRRQRGGQTRSAEWLEKLRKFEQDFSKRSEQS